MNEPTIHHEDHSFYRLAKNRFVALIAGTIVISLIFVAISLSLYASSGAAQLDLSRPGYVSVRKEASEYTPTIETFPSDGPIDDKALEDFRKLYDKASTRVTSVSVFGDDALSDASLRITPKNDQQ